MEKSTKFMLGITGVIVIIVVFFGVFSFLSTPPKKIKSTSTQTENLF